MAEETTEATGTEKKLKAKTTSLIGQIVAGIWIGGWSAYKFITAETIGVNDVIFSGLAIAACFTPVYFSIMLDKIKEIKYGEQ